MFPTCFRAVSKERRKTLLHHLGNFLTGHLATAPLQSILPANWSPFYVPIILCSTSAAYVGGTLQHHLCHLSWRAPCNTTSVTYLGGTLESEVSSKLEGLERAAAEAEFVNEPVIRNMAGWQEKVTEYYAHFRKFYLPFYLTSSVAFAIISRMQI